MSVTTQAPPPSAMEIAAGIAHRLGDIPIGRIILDPAPGTATEADLLRHIDVDQAPCEWVEGTLVEKPVGFEEGLVSSNLIRVMGNFVHSRRLGAVTPGDTCLRMMSGSARAPDVTYVSKADVPADYRRGTPVPRLPPTLAVEVLSEGNTAAEMRQKCREYFDSGSKLVWIVDPPTRTIAIYTGPTAGPDRTLTEADTLDGGHALPGFTILVAELFRDPFAL